MSSSSACDLGQPLRSSARSRGVRTPETTSLPCAFGRKSPEGSGAPVTSSREKATPLPLRAPRLPKTICCTFTAVPHSSGMRLMRRYATARSPCQESNTARTAPAAAARVGRGTRTGAELGRQLAQRARVELGVELHAAPRLRRGDRLLEALAGDPDRRRCRTSATKRRCESHAKRSSPERAARPRTVSSFRPRFRTVSSIPGIDSRAPERTDTSSGSLASPSCAPPAPPGAPGRPRPAPAARRETRPSACRRRTPRS